MKTTTTQITETTEYEMSDRLLDSIKKESEAKGEKFNLSTYLNRLARSAAKKAADATDKSDFATSRYHWKEYQVITQRILG